MMYVALLTFSSSFSPSYCLHVPAHSVWLRWNLLFLGSVCLSNLFIFHLFGIFERNFTHRIDLFILKICGFSPLFSVSFKYRNKLKLSEVKMIKTYNTHMFTLVSGCWHACVLSMRCIKIMIIHLFSQFFFFLGNSCLKFVVCVSSRTPKGHQTFRTGGDFIQKEFEPWAWASDTEFKT